MSKFIPILAFTLLALSSCKTPSILVTEEQRLGDQYNNRHEYEQAIVHYRNCLDAGAKLGVYRNLDMEADVCRKISHAHQVLGRYDEALEYTRYALQKDSLQGNTLEMIEDYRDLGAIHIYRGDFLEGTTYLQKALDMNEGMEASLKGQNQLSVADTYLSLAQVNSVLGRFGTALEYAETALTLYRRLREERGEMEALLVLGKIQINAGTPELAAGTIQESIGICENLGLNTARHLNAMAEILKAEGQLEKALSHNLRALDQARESRIVPQVVWANMRAGDSYRDVGDTEEALARYTAAREMQDSSGMQARALEASADMRLGKAEDAQRYYLDIGSDVAGGLATLKVAEMQAESGQTGPALQSYAQAVELFTRSGVNEGAAQAYLRIGDLRIIAGEPEPASDALESAQALARYPENRWQVWYQLGRLAELEGLQDSAIVRYERSIRIIEQIRGNFTIDDLKSRYIDDKVKVYDRLIRLLRERGDLSASFSYAERAKARAFLDLIGSKKLEAGARPGRELIQQEQELRMQIQNLTRIMQKNELETTRGMSTREVYAELHRSQEEYTRLLQRIKLENAEYHSMVSIEPVDADGVAAGLDAGTALLYYWIGEESSAAWVFSRNGMRSVNLDLTASEARRMVDLCRQVVRRTAEFRGGGDWRSDIQIPVPDRRPVSAREQFSEAYKRLISPVYPLLEDYASIGIVPHGPLHFLPFQALIAPDGTFLVEKHNLFYVPSSSVYEQCLEKEGHPRLDFMGMALGDLSLGTFSGLPGTTWELDQIKTNFPQGTFTYEQSSTESFFKENAERYEYIHLATHGMMNPVQPVFSFMLMNPTQADDGQLTVNEVFGMNLNARLVTLSACETGLGDLSRGDEVVGLSRAFIFAGSPSVIVSLWSVADRPTAELMASFYRHLKDHPPFVALNMAQRETMKKFPAPFYWAPFQLIGTGK